MPQACQRRCSDTVKSTVRTLGTALDRVGRLWTLSPCPYSGIGLFWDGRRHRGTVLDYSHSIINEQSKLLISKWFQVARSIFTVIFTVKVSGTSIGAGFRAIRRKVTFRDLSRSIDSKNDSSHRRCAPKPVQATSESASPSSALSHCLTSLFHSLFYRQDADVLGRCCARTGRLQTASVSITSMKRPALNPSGYRVQAERLVSASRDWSAR